MSAREPCSEVVTGLGLVTPVGSDPSSVVEAVREGRSGIAPARSFDTESLRTRWFGEVDDDQLSRWSASRARRRLDKATRMAAAACESALTGAGLADAPEVLERAGLCFGVSGGGQAQSLRVAPDGSCVVSLLAAHLVARNTPQFSSASLAQIFRIKGPVFTLCNASASGGIALAFALSLLRQRRADVVLVGSAEALTLLNVVALDCLNMTATKPCAPFTGASGITLGEGAAFFVLERREHAQARGARVLADVLAATVASDGYDTLGNDPAGRGLASALRSAFDDAGISADEVDWIKASGTGSDAQDRAERVALGEVYSSSRRMPPVVCLEPIFGHPNGAAPLIGLATAIAFLQRGITPKAYPLAVPGVLTTVANDSTRAPRLVASSAMGFGGSNAVALVGSPGTERRRRIASSARVAIVGCGVVSPFGHGIAAFRDGLLSGSRAFLGCALGMRGVSRLVARVPHPVRPLARVGRGPRDRGRLRDFAVAAATEALDRAGLEADEDLRRTALVVSMAHGPVAAQQTLLQGICRGPQSVATGRLLLDMSRFAVVSDLCQALRLRGFSTSLAGGIGSGLQALICAVNLLQADPGLRFALVVGVDELCPLYLELFERLGILAEEARGFAPYDRARPGLVLGEGAAAFVLQRQSDDASSRASDCVISGHGATCDALGFWRSEPDGSGLARAIEVAVRDAKCSLDGVDGFYGSGRGLAGEDSRELSALRRLFVGRERALPIGCVTGNVGVAEASCSLFGVAAASIGMRENVVFPALTQGELPEDVDFVRAAPRFGDYRRLLVGASSEDGGNAAVVLERP